MSIDLKHLAYLDLEMTGLDPARHEIIELGILKPDAYMPAHLDCTHPIEGWSAFTCKVKPEHIETALPRALEINRYTPEEWARAPALVDVFPVFHSLLEGALLVGHNVWTDCLFLAAACERFGLPEPDWKYRIDTTTLIWEHLTPLGHDSLSLESACEIVGIDNTGSHRVLRDMLRTKALVNRLTTATLTDQLAWILAVSELAAKG